MAEISNGVKILLERMASHPEDFFGDALRWRFIFADKFRDVLTEPEKGMIHEALKNLRRVEFDGLVVRSILQDEEEKKEEEEKVAAELEAKRRAQGRLAQNQQPPLRMRPPNIGTSNEYINPLQNIFK
jgi:hypothetical protein